MKKILSITLLLCMVLGMMPITASADVVESGTCGESLTWEFDSDGTLTISGDGKMGDYSNGTQPWNDVRRQVKKVVVNEGVTTIGKYAFYRCDILDDVKLPDSLTRIGDSAFFCCYALTEIDIPKSVTYLGPSAFYSCENLKAIDISGIESINNHTFWECRNLSDVKWSDKISYVGSGAFYNCDGIKSVTLSNYTWRVGIEAFKDCSSLTTINLGNKIESIGYRAFQSCENLKSIVIPDTLTELGAAVFMNCTSLESVRMSNNVQSIETMAFADCTSLKSIVLPDSVGYIGDLAFCGCTSLAELKMGDGIKVIYEAAFEQCSSLKTLRFGAGVETIEEAAFMSCYGLETIYLPKSVKSIGQQAFPHLSPRPKDLYYEGSAEEYNSLSNIYATAVHYNCIFDATIDATFKEADGAFLAEVDLGEDNNTKRLLIDGEELYYSFQRGKYVGIVSGDKVVDNKLTDVVIAEAEPTSFRYGNLADDSDVDSSDLQAMKLAIKGISPFTGVNVVASDVNGDGLFDGADLHAMKLFRQKRRQFPILK